MNQVLDTLGISAELFNYFILPILIFLARIFDVSIATLRIIFVMNGKKFLAPLLGFFESLVWLIAIGQIIQNIDNWVSYLAFASGFATGTFVGILIEEKLALGNLVVRVITRKEAIELIDFLKNNNYQYSIVEAEGKYGKVNILFSVIKRSQVKRLLNAIKMYNPQAFYTIESVKSVSETGIQAQNANYKGFKMLNLKRR
jgi:uncharacterized protein YebE (UPF0316 family)